MLVDENFRSVEHRPHFTVFNFTSVNLKKMAQCLKDKVKFKSYCHEEVNNDILRDGFEFSGLRATIRFNGERK
jgi:hypothetical protein